MLGLKVTLDGDDAWPDLREKRDSIIHLSNDAPPLQVLGLSGGMQSGRPSVALRLDLPCGCVVVAETSMVLFLAAAQALRARYESELG